MRRVFLVMCSLLVVVSAWAATNYYDNQVFRGTVTFGQGGSPISYSYRVAAEYDPPNISTNSCTAMTLAFTGSRPTDAVAIILPYPSPDLRIQASAGTDAVSMSFCNTTGGAVDAAAGIYGARVFRDGG